MVKHARACFLAFCAVATIGPAARADKAACAAAAEVGQRLAKAHKLVAAREQLLLCSSKECPDIVAQDCTQWLGEVERSVASVVLKPRDVAGQSVSDVRVTENGVVVVERTSDVPIEMDPGPHTLRFEKKGFDALENHVELAEGKRGQEIIVDLRATVDLAPIAHASSGRSTGLLVSAIAASGLALVGGGLYAGFGLSGTSDQNDLKKTCAPNCTPSQTSPVATKFTIANVGLVSGLVALAAAGVLWVVWGTSAPSSPRIGFDGATFVF